jgi:hypothetical protein
MRSMHSSSSRYSRAHHGVNGVKQAGLKVLVNIVYSMEWLEWHPMSTKADTQHPSFAGLAGLVESCRMVVRQPNITYMRTRSQGST